VVELVAGPTTGPEVRGSNPYTYQHNLFPDNLQQLHDAYRVFSFGSEQ
jgi:hypothetical protein